jgi:PAS domain S-box-containing protein
MHSAPAHAGGPASASAAATTALNSEFFLTLGIVFLGYFVAGTLGQAPTNIRSSNLGPVWPAYGIALAAFLKYGYRVWPAIAASAFVIAVQGSVSAAAAAGQACAATLAAATGASMLRRIRDFDPALSRLRDALGLIVFGAFGSALISSALGIASLYGTGIQPYSGITSAWLIYWLGDSTGVLLVTPLVFTLPRLVGFTAPVRAIEGALLAILLTVACFAVFGDWPLIPIRLHVLAFAVLPFVMWAAINFGVGGAAVSVFWVAVIATVLTALGLGPFAGNTPVVNAVLLDVLFIVLSVSGLTLAAVITEREALIREQASVDARLHLAAIVESSDDAIWSHDVDGVIRSWNAAAEQIFGFTAAEAIGRPVAMIIPSDKQDEDTGVVRRLQAGERVVHRETMQMTKSGTLVPVSLTISPLKDSAGHLIGVTKIARDITEQQRAREALSAANRRLIEAQEQERARIARDLHDDVVQRLALVSAQLMPTAAGTISENTNLRQLVAEIAGDVQTLSHTLHSPKLELLGIAPAFKRFCEEFAERQNVTIACDAHDVPAGLPSEVSLCLYRILQEGLSNAAKHSGTRHFEVELFGRPGQIDLVVRDRGVGFDVAAARASRGIGLVSMEERIKLVNGELSIQSVPLRGTAIHAQVPLRTT